MWLVIGIIVGALLIWMGISLNMAHKGLTWYEWLIGLIGVALLLFTIQNYFGSQAELEPKAANMFLLVTGLPALIFLAVAWQLWARRKKTA
jgi:hypothetical protein